MHIVILIIGIITSGILINCLIKSLIWTVISMIDIKKNKKQNLENSKKSPYSNNTSVSKQSFFSSSSNFSNPSSSSSSNSYNSYSSSNDYASTDSYCSNDSSGGCDCD